MRRFAAAQANDCGLQILNLPQVAARLAGGFAIPASADQLEPAIREALDEGGYAQTGGDFPAAWEQYRMAFLPKTKPRRYLT
jgi:hypothetical protein